jgi:chromosomal replication initiator protein
VQGTLWHHCLRHLENEVPEQQFNTWVRPLQAIERDGELQLLAPNRFVVSWIEKNLFGRITELVSVAREGSEPRVRLDIGARPADIAPVEEPRNPSFSSVKPREPQVIGSRFNPEFTFASFVEGKSNQLARAAAHQVGKNPGQAYNPLFIYGGVGLGKTHLMHAIGNLIRERNPGARIAYVHSERFVSEMVRALQHNTINEFKQTYRTLDALLIDDIQFFAGKTQSQEEFFHTFNALLEGQQQIIMYSDR